MWKRAAAIGVGFASLTLVGACLYRPRGGVAAQAVASVRQQKTIVDLVDNYDRHVRPILEKKCAQCHTSTSERPFYYDLPVVGLVMKPYIDGTIRQGRSHFDFSEGLPVKRLGATTEFLIRIREAVHADTMPPTAYTLAHPLTRLTREEKRLLFEWAETGAGVLAAERTSPASAEGSAPAGPGPVTSAAKAAEIAKAIVAACPVADPTLPSAQKDCAEKLAKLDILKTAMSDPFLWGQHAHTTRFNPLVFRKLYLSLLMFPGTFSIKEEGDLLVIRFPYQFRGGLDAGLYPYPFWHSGKKWTNYHQCKDLLLVVKNGTLVGGMRSAERHADPQPMTSRKWDGKWSWLAGAIQEPHVTLFENLFSSGNPYVGQLDAAYRKMALGFQSFNCLGCHSPDNDVHMKMLELFNLPNQALSARGRLVTALESNTMPPGKGIEDPTSRRTLTELAREFKTLGDKAFEFEGEKQPDRMNVSLSAIQPLKTSQALRAFVTNYDDNTVSVIDPEAGRVVATVKTGANPMGVGVAPDGKAVYVSNEADGTLSVVSPTSNEVVGTVPLGPNPRHLAVSADGRHVFTALNGSNTVAVVDTAARKVVKLVPVGREPHMVLRSPDGKTIYANSQGEGKLVAIDASTFEVTRQIAVMAAPRPFTITPDGKKIFQTIRWFNGVLIVDPIRNQIVDQVPVGDSQFAPEGREAHGCDVTPDGKQLWLTTQNAEELTILDAQSNGVVGKMKVGKEANWIRFTPDGKRAILSSTKTDSVSIVSVPDRKVVATMKVGSHPKRLAVGMVVTR
jgi:YVTN family beta-propeller protein